MSIDLDKPWQYGPRAWQAAHNVHAPWIAEISPWQYANMSTRQKRAYDAKRDREWTASGECKAEWARAVIEAFDAGYCDLRSPDLHPDAQSTIIHELIRRKKMLREDALQQALDDNKILPGTLLEPGTRVFSLMSSSYIIITKADRRGMSVRAVYENPPAWAKGREMKYQVGALQWKSYNDVVAEIDAEFVR